MDRIKLLLVLTFLVTLFTLLTACRSGSIPQEDIFGFNISIHEPVTIEMTRSDDNVSGGVHNDTDLPTEGNQTDEEDEGDVADDSLEDEEWPDDDVQAQDGDLSGSDASPEKSSYDEGYLDEGDLANGAGDDRGGLPPDEKSVESARYIPQVVYPIVVVAVVILLLMSGVVAHNRRRKERVMKGLRRDIYEYVKFNPGSHFSAIKYEFDMSFSTTTHHLSVLQRDEKVVSHRGGKHKRYYANVGGIYGGAELRKHLVGLEYSVIVSALKNDNRRAIVECVLNAPECTQSDIVRATGMSASTISWHMNRLERDNILVHEKQGKFNSYGVVDPDRIAGAIEIIERQ